MSSFSFRINDYGAPRGGGLSLFDWYVLGVRLSNEWFVYFPLGNFPRGQRHRTNKSADWLVVSLCIDPLCIFKIPPFLAESSPSRELISPRDLWTWTHCTLAPRRHWAWEWPNPGCCGQICGVRWDCQYPCMDLLTPVLAFKVSHKEFGMYIKEETHHWASKGLSKVNSTGQGQLVVPGKRKSPMHIVDRKVPCPLMNHTSVRRNT